MGLDKLRIATPNRPSVSCFDRINADYRLPPEERRFNYAFTYRDHVEVDSIGITCCVRISTKRDINPQYMIELNFIVPKLPPLTIFETNPNNYDRGWREVEDTVYSIFGRFDDLKNTRMDLNAETETASVHYFRDSMRVPLKRASGDVGKERDRQEWKRGGIETVRFGKSPSQVQVYNKIQELKFKGEDYIDRLPAVLTRLEYRLGGVRCPITHFHEIRQLLMDCRPFAAIQLTDVPQYYDYKVDPNGSMARRLYHGMVEDLGAQEAIAQLNRNRNFVRNFRAIVINNESLKREIEESYLRSNKRLLSGQGASVKHLYIHCSWCNLRGADVHPCGGCGVRMCLACKELNEGHEQTCPERDGNGR